MTRERAIVEIKDLVQQREEQRRPRHVGGDGFRPDILQHDDVTEAQRVALKIMRAPASPA